MDARQDVGHDASGFTLVEVLVALGILAVVMTILYGTFATSAATVEIVEQRADELSSLAGALDTLSHEVRAAHHSFSGTKSLVLFTAMTPFQPDTAPVIQTVSYEFDQGRLVRKVFQAGPTTSTPRVFVLLDEVAEPSFAFFDGRAWIDEWRSREKVPGGVKVTFSYRGKTVETVIPVWARDARRPA